MSMLTQLEEKRALESFCRFLQFETVSNTAPKTGEYLKAADYLLQELSSIPCLDQIHLLEEAPGHSPVVVARWKGLEENLPVILLNSHYDVVPADKQDWTVEPFEGIVRDGKIYGRGAQDMKCVCIQYIEAIRKLSSSATMDVNTLSSPPFQPRRSIYLTFVPDEEVGGGGMAAFLSSKLYQNLPGIALALDEGLASENDVFSVFYGERLPWWVEITAKGNTGHGSRFIEHTAIEQIIEVANRALAFREGQKAVLHGSPFTAKHENCAHAVAAKKMRQTKELNGGSAQMTLGDVTSLNITVLEAGIRSGDHYVTNVVPPVAKCALDIRISPHVPPIEIKNMLNQWCQECSSSEEDGHALTWNYIGERNNAQEHAVTSTDGVVNPWYDIFGSALSIMGYSFTPQVFPAATDSRFLRAVGIRALGFSPMRNTKIMLHENDEYLEEDIFLEGITVYIGLIEKLSSQGGDVL